MGLGFWHNVLEHAASLFRKAGKPFSEAAKWTRPYVEGVKAAKTLVMRNREDKMFRRAQPFMHDMPGGVKPTEAFTTPTTLMLSGKHQYLFKVKFRYTDKPLDEYEYLSFVTNDALTKREAEIRMGDILDVHRNAAKYQHLKTIEMSLEGTRTSMWLP